MKKIFRFKKGFTLSELVAAMMVIAMVVAVTLPITLKKMKKVDSTAYYMGYETVKEISANILKSVIEDNTEETPEEENKCHFELNGTCYGKPFVPSRLSYSECVSLKSQLGINTCISGNSSGESWGGAVKACGGKSNMASGQQLTELTEYIYNKTGLGMGTHYDVSMNKTRLAEVGFEDTNYDVWIWSPEETSCTSIYSCSANGRFMSSTTTWYKEGDRAGSYTQAICVNGINGGGDEETPDTGGDTGSEAQKEYTTQLCGEVQKKFNNTTNKCSVAVSTVKSAAASNDFSSVEPHITLSNGLKIYFGSEMESIPQLAGASSDDRTGFIIYIDVNGKSGKSLLYEDVFPFYLLKSGKVVPGINTTVAGGGNNNQHLSFNVLYDVYSDGNRSVKVLLKDADFRRAACATGYVTSTTYCGINSVDTQKAVQYDLCKEAYHDCRFIVNKPFKPF